MALGAFWTDRPGIFLCLNVIHARVLVPDRCVHQQPEQLVYYALVLIMCTSPFPRMQVYAKDAKDK